MPTVADIAALLERLTPLHLAEDWDNVGLLIGDRTKPVERVMTCLTLTPDSVGEAVERAVQLVVSHHPLPFRPLNRVTDDAVEGRLLLDLIGAGVAVYSPHTAFDSAAEGINRQLANGLGLVDAKPLQPSAADPTVGAGRLGRFPNSSTLAGVADAAKGFLKLNRVRVVGRDDQPVASVAVACGSGGSLLDAATAIGCDALVTGEASFHTCLAAEARGVGLVLVGHYASERFAVEWLAERLAGELPGIEIWPSRAEHDPIRTLG